MGIFSTTLPCEVWKCLLFLLLFFVLCAVIMFTLASFMSNCDMYNDKYIQLYNTSKRKGKGKGMNARYLRFFACASKMHLRSHFKYGLGNMERIQHIFVWFVFTDSV